MKQAKKTSSGGAAMSQDKKQDQQQQHQGLQAQAQQQAKAGQAATTTQQQAVQTQQKTALPLREMSVIELVSLAMDRRRKRKRESRRVPIRLKPSLIPPPTGEYETSLGRVRIYSRFEPEEGGWFVEVKLPNQSGFKLSDHLK
jgi:hypothetical protein